MHKVIKTRTNLKGKIEITFVKNVNRKFKYFKVNSVRSYQSITSARFRGSMNSFNWSSEHQRNPTFWDATFVARVWVSAFCVTI